MSPLHPTIAPRAGGIYVAVADLHGHVEHLRALLAHLDHELGSGYHLVLLGDYVDNGPDIPGLLDVLIDLRTARAGRFSGILGNHDLACLRTLGWPGTTSDEAQPPGRLSPRAARARKASTSSRRFFMTGTRA